MSVHASSADVFFFKISLQINMSEYIHAKYTFGVQGLAQHEGPGSNPLVGTVPTFFLFIFLLNFPLFPQFFSCPMHTQVHKHIRTHTHTHTYTHTHPHTTYHA